ncbi:MAG TPA: hypothetical protein PKM25_09170 [Candidatus Ozemobacteraceae bacterium]|nr:hypothetical protein [Candidatus Ozemobacteraceae bacterium]
MDKSVSTVFVAIAAIAAMAAGCPAVQAQVWPDAALVASEPAVPVTLRFQPKRASIGSFSIEVQSRTAIQMLLVPKSTLMGQINIDGSFSLEPGKDGRAVQAFHAVTASMAYYSPGAPNREIPRETVIQTLLVSGLPAPDHPVRVSMNGHGKVVGVEGVPASYTRYYEASLLEYTEQPLLPGDSWCTRNTIPVCIDPDGETVLCDAIATFSLLALDASSDAASIEFSSTFFNARESASATGKIHGTSRGKITVKQSDGSPIRSESTSNSRLDFGGGNAIDMEQRIKTAISEAHVETK